MQSMVNVCIANISLTTISQHLRSVHARFNTDILYKSLFRVFVQGHFTLHAAELISTSTVGQRKQHSIDLTVYTVKTLFMDTLVMESLPN